MRELLQVGQRVPYWQGEDSDRKQMTIIKILYSDGTDIKKLCSEDKNRGDNWAIISGSNLLDDPRADGLFEADKIYVFE